jgi:hypothetical protein
MFLHFLLTVSIGYRQEAALYVAVSVPSDTKKMIFRLKERHFF